MKRGQVIVEFIIILTVLLLILLFIAVSLQARKTQVRLIKEEFAASRIADGIVGAMVRVQVRGPGANETLYVPQTLEGHTNYTLSVQSHLLALRWEDNVYTSPMGGVVTSASTISQGGYVTFSNVGGELLVS